jgi:organic hydroperoxide reductase OsmC/OhrA
MAVRAKELRYAVDIADGDLVEEHGIRLDAPAEWSPEHLLLAALVRCSLKSLRYHAEQTGVAVSAAAGTCRTLVTKRETDKRYALVETEVELSVELEPEPESLAELLAAAERDCFIGSSLTAKPHYRWAVNGRAVRA